MATKGKGLGKGLGSLLGEVADINRIGNISPITEEEMKAEKNVKIRLVEPNREQPRKEFNEEALAELAESIKVHGVIQPLIVTKKEDHYEIVAGERRWRAAKIAGLSEVPVIVKDYTEREIAEISLIENIQRTDLNPIEEAEAYQKLIRDYNLTQEALSERVSKSRTVITNSMRLLKLPKEVRLLLSEGKISTGHAKVLLGIEDENRLIVLSRKITEENLSVRETEELIKKENAVKVKEKDSAKPIKNDAAYEKVEQELKEILGTKVSVSRNAKNKGKIEINFYSLEDIERILSHIK